MKTLVIKFLFPLMFLLGIVACGGGDSSSGGSSGTDIKDVVLTHGKSVSCTDENTFSVEPSSGNSSDVTFTKNTSTGMTTITYNSLEGSATVVGCKQP